MVQIVPVVHFLASAIQVAQHGSEINPRGIHQRFVGQIEGGADGQQLSAHRADLGIHLPGIGQRLDEVRKQQDIRIQSQHPLAAAHADRLVLCRGKADILVVVNHPAAVHELLQDIRRAIGGGIIDDDDFLIGVTLRENRLQAPLNESTAIKCDDCDGNPIVT